MKSLRVSAAISSDIKVLMEELAMKHKRSLSSEIAVAIDMYLQQFKKESIIIEQNTSLSNVKEEFYSKQNQNSVNSNQTETSNNVMHQTMLQNTEEHSKTTQNDTLVWNFGVVDEIEEI